MSPANIGAVTDLTDEQVARVKQKIGDYEHRTAAVNAGGEPSASHRLLIML